MLKRVCITSVEMVWIVGNRKANFKFWFKFVISTVGRELHQISITAWKRISPCGRNDKHVAYKPYFSFRPKTKISIIAILVFCHFLK